MGTLLIIYLFIATHSHAKIIFRSNSDTSISISTTAALDSSLSVAATTSSSLFDVDEELAKIAASCLNNSNYEQLTGNVVRHTIARVFGHVFLSGGEITIGLTELRAAPTFAPLREWKHFNSTKPSEDELAAAPSIEAYYDLKEPRSSIITLDSNHLFEHNVATAIAYLDARFPSIRAIYRHTFEKIRRSEAVLDRKAIDRMIDEFRAIHRRVRNATDAMQLREECRDD